MGNIRTWLVAIGMVAILLALYACVAVPVGIVLGWLLGSMILGFAIVIVAPILFILYSIK